MSNGRNITESKLTENFQECLQGQGENHYGQRSRRYMTHIAHSTNRQPSFLRIDSCPRVFTTAPTDLRLHQYTIGKYIHYIDAPLRPAWPLFFYSGVQHRFLSIDRWNDTRCKVFKSLSRQMFGTPHHVRQIYPFEYVSGLG